MTTAWLMDTYNYLLLHNVFEVVLVAYETDDSSQINPEELFESMFSRMPWTAIPFPDITSRERLITRVGLLRCNNTVTSFIVDPSGLVLETGSSHLFDTYGGMYYPFTSKWIEYLESQDDAVVKQPTLQALLASPERNYASQTKGVRYSHS